ncbi:MAG: Zn-dependent hydrolase, partial [Clostridia bacterium]|nr:Zn-dependent hydrolase [Clostridia bacterium]
MKKTYITTMPNHIGAFLKASECFAELGVNITRVSYNKAIDSHTLFIDVEGDEENLKKADALLYKLGYLPTSERKESVVLLEFTLADHPGSVTEVLRLIYRYELNISYISSQENGTGYQAFKMGLYVGSEARLKEFLAEALELCPVRILDYNHS